MKLKTILYYIYIQRPSDGFWKKLLKGLGEDPNFNEDREVSLRFILENNGLDDALWALREHDGFGEIAEPMKWYKIWCAERVRHLMNDKRSTNALDVAKQYLNREATRDEMGDAVDEAYKAARSAWTGWDGLDNFENQLARYAAWGAVWNALFGAQGRVNEKSNQTAIAARYAIEAAGLNVEEELKAQTEEFLRLIECHENGIEYTI